MGQIRIKTIVEEDFNNYKYPSMLIGCISCDFKCCKEYGENFCQNSELVKSETKIMDVENIYKLYNDNKITRAIVFGGLEPMLQFDEIIDFIEYFRNHGCVDDVIIYTGYKKNELHYETGILKRFCNIIIKYGRYIPNQKKHFDDVLGVNLASDNQYAERIS